MKDCSLKYSAMCEPVAPREQKTCVLAQPCLHRDVIAHASLNIAQACPYRHLPRSMPVRTATLSRCRCCSTFQPESYPSLSAQAASMLPCLSDGAVLSKCHVAAHFIVACSFTWSPAQLNTQLNINSKDMAASGMPWQSAYEACTATGPFE